MTKKTIAWIGAVLMAGAFAVACGGSKKAPVGPTPPANEGTMGGDAYGGAMGGDPYGGGDMGNPCGANPCGG